MKETYEESAVRVYRQRVKRTIMSGEEMLDDFLTYLKHMEIELKKKEKSDTNGDS